MTILSMPASPDFADTQFGLVSNTQTDLTSPLSRTTQFLELPGARWKARYELPPMAAAAARPWLSFLTRLRGRAGQFYGFDPSFHPRRPAGAAGAFALRVAGAGQTGRSLAIDGADPLAAGVFKTGDYLAYDVGTGRQLHMATADASADSSGEVTVTFEPPIRVSPADNAVIITSDASCVMRLVDDEVLWSVDRRQIARIVFEAIEVF